MKNKKKKLDECNCDDNCTCGTECNCTEENKCSEDCTCNEECNCTDDCQCGDECNCGDECHCEHDSNINDERELLGKRIKDLEEALLRNQAELINFKKRKEDETNRIIKYAEEDILKGFLPILDNFERAIGMDDDNLDDEVSKFLEGFKLMYKQLKDLLSKFEVEEIECLDKEFDPTYQQAVTTGNDESKESGIVLEVLQKGYMYKDRVLRTAMVKVNE